MSVQESLGVINGRLDKLQYRMDRIEKGLNKLLEIFGQPVLEAEPQELGKETPLASSGLNGIDHGLPSAPIANGHEAQDLTLLPKQPEGGVISPVLDSTKNDPAVYTALDAAKSQIRVLALYPCEDDPAAPIVASLHVQSLDEDVYITTSTFRQYIALSYTWGAPTPTSTIQLDGHDFPITKSLEAALRAMRIRGKDPTFGHATVWPHNAKTPTFWWIDQICINQADVDERNEQVALMRRIYKRAASVQVWLGEERDQSGMAMDLINTLGASPVRTPGDKVTVYPSLGVSEVDKHWRALDALFKRPWWNRVWIRQEIALASTVMLVCGDKSVTMDALGPTIAALEYAMRLGYVPSFLDVGQSPAALSTTKEVGLPWTHNPNSITNLRRATSGGYLFVALTYLLPPSRACKATDPRDTVFSTLGMCDPEIFHVAADYRMNLKEVLVSATQAVITKNNGLNILGACQNVARTNELPSWVPNLNQPWKALPFATSKGDSRGGSQMHELLVTEKETAIVRIDGECLSLRGGHIDSIALLCEDIVPSNPTTEQLETTFTQWKAFVSKAAEGKQLHERDHYNFTDRENFNLRMNWVRFLTVLSDEARDLDGRYTHLVREREKKKKIAGTHNMSVDEILRVSEDELREAYTYHHLNLRLARSYLLPSTPDPFPVRLHPDRRAHAGLARNGPGRRICVTKRGFIALVPDEADVEDQITIFQGASFPYVLRKHGGKKRHVLVGEAFAPSYANGKAEGFAKDEFRVGLDAIIRLY